ncbi:hypothetical protein MIND_00188900 [Mycena indigotica]|uniref:C3H1-type domain-containing protein n=1 Tax=Mycena indigotica TaxID=2126181 RepID=A0A8H6WGS9_9AGAR|nr:uncharacterized protein MIND_00188900 [Mycena indigotica]KAF7311784.1 hypothetical protein MIND_00188900 [Mycena indigotica]
MADTQAAPALPTPALTPTPALETGASTPAGEREDVVVVLTADDADARERLLATRAIRRIESAAKRREQAGEKREAGVAAMRAQEYEAAAAAFGEACALWRTNPVLRCDLATAWMHLGRFEDAEASASNALNLDPKLVEARYVRGMARKGRGVLRAAIVDFETVLQLDPKNEPAQAQLRELTAEPLPDSPSDPDFDPADPLITSTLPALPTLDPDLLSTSDTSDANHTGSGTPCLFYNHGGCLRGSACAFSHAADHKSVRDGLGKNVCLYHLLGLCKFGAKCIYSHERKWLADGWWDDAGVVDRVKTRVEREREGRKERREEREREKEKRKEEKGRKEKGKRRGGKKSVPVKQQPGTTDPLTAEIERRMAVMAAMGIPTGTLSPNDVLRQMQAIAASGMPLPYSPMLAETPGISVPLSPGLQLGMLAQMQAGQEQIRELEGRMRELKGMAERRKAAEEGIEVPVVEVQAASPAVGSGAGAA